MKLMLKKMQVKIGENVMTHEMKCFFILFLYVFLGGVEGVMLVSLPYLFSSVYACVCI